VNLVDSSGWIEVLADAPGADFFVPVLGSLDELLVPRICMVEVVRYLYRERGEHEALQAMAQMRQGNVVDIDVPIVMSAARLGKAHRLPLADSLVLATARLYDAVVWTQDSDFEGLEGVRYTPKKK
jgi:predicted nucleic acid-binding protein